MISEKAWGRMTPRILFANQLCMPYDSLSIKIFLPHPDRRAQFVLQSKRLQVRFPVMAHDWAVDLVLGRGAYKRQMIYVLSPIDVSLPFFVHHYPSLQINKQNRLKKTYFCFEKILGGTVVILALKINTSFDLAILHVGINPKKRFRDMHQHLFSDIFFIYHSTILLSTSQGPGRTKKTELDPCLRGACIIVQLTWKKRL